MKSGPKRRVAVIFGGKSGEHEVSLESAVNVMAAMDRDRFEVIPVGITRQGRWLAGGDPMAALRDGTESGARAVTLSTDPQRRGLVFLDSGPGEGLLEFDAAFPVLHGTFGEDGAVQGLFEMADVPYAGAGVLASAAGMDKAVMKSIFIQAELATPDFFVIKRCDWEQPGRERFITRAEDRFGYPCFVKPANLGSSVGISKAPDRAGFVAAVDLAAEFDRRIIVEKYINCREIEVALLGNNEPLISVPGEILPANEFYDYDAKYVRQDSGLVIPAELDPAIADRIRRMAARAWDALDCAGMARFDFFVHRESNAVFINEINTIPGFTQISMYPKLMQASGVEYPELIARLIDLALELHEDKRRCRREFSARE